MSKKTISSIKLVVAFKLFVLLTAFFTSPVGFIIYSLLFAFVDFQTIKEIPVGLKRFTVLALVNIAVFFAWTIIVALGMGYPFVTVFHIAVMAFAWTLLFGVPMDLFGDKEVALNKHHIKKSKTCEIVKAEIVEE